MLEYKLLTQRDSIFSGKFDLDALETALNSCAAESWRAALGPDRTTLFSGRLLWASD